MRHCAQVYHYTNRSAAKLQPNPPLAILHIMFSNHYILTKRHLGIALLIVGSLAFIAIMLIDVLDVGREGGIGPAQRIALGASIGLALLGLTLIPLGNRPA